jgi:hypothetical protein
VFSTLATLRRPSWSSSLVTSDDTSACAVDGCACDGDGGRATLWPSGPGRRNEGLARSLSSAVGGPTRERVCVCVCVCSARRRLARLLIAHSFFVCGLFFGERGVFVF